MNKYFLGIVIIHFLFLFPLFKPGIFNTHDGQLHIARIAAYDKAITDGQFPVRWAANLNYGYGSPLFIFYYPLPYTLGTILHRMGLSYTDAFKLLLGAAFVAAPIGFYFWIRLVTASEKIAAVSALLYGLAPYHFLDLFVRGAIGELFAFVCIPMVLLGIENIYNKKNKIGFFLISIFYAMLILSHNAFALLFTFVFIFYALLRLKGLKQLLVLFFSILLGLGLSAHFWLPAIVEQKYTHGDLFVNATYKDNFPGASQLVWSPWGLGTRVSRPDGLSPQIGVVQILVVLLAFYFMNKNGKTRWIFRFGITLFLVGLFMTLRYSIFLWDHIAFLKKFEFPWRFSALTGFAAATLSAFVLLNKPNKMFLIFIASGLILLTLPLLLTGPNTYYPDSYYETYSHSTEFGAASTIWSAGDPSTYPKTPIEIASGQAAIGSYERSGTTHTYDLVAKTPSTVIDNTLYYPGWHVEVNNKETPIEFQDTNHRGLITFAVSKGESTVRVFFKETTFRIVTDIISILSVICLLVVFAYSI